VSSLIEVHYIKFTLAIAFIVTILVFFVYAINLRKLKVIITIQPFSSQFRLVISSSDPSYSVSYLLMLEFILKYTEMQFP
jgi:hypothetical protein